MGEGSLDRAKWRGGGSHFRGLDEEQHGSLATRGKCNQSSRRDATASKQLENVSTAENQIEVK